MATATVTPTEGRVVVEIPVHDADGAQRFEERYLDEFPDQLELLSPAAGLRMSLIPPRYVRDPVTGRKETIDEGESLVFRQGRCVISRELLPYVTRHSAFTGRGEKAIVYLPSDPRAATAAALGVGVVTGAMSSNRGLGDGTPPPLPGWDDMTPAQITQAVAQGRVTDPMSALAFEFRVPNGKRRERVKRVLWAAAEGEPVLDDAPIDTESGAAMPPEERKV